MKAIAKVIRGSVRAQATTTGGLMAMAYALPTGIKSKAETTDQSDLHLYLDVSPVEPQQLVWLVPQYGIDYTVTATRGLEWLIK